MSCEVNNIYALSGGKDSTAMVHMALERGESIHSVVWFDTKWEFPEMYERIDLFEKKIGLQVVRLTSTKSFEHWMFDQEVIARKGPNKGRIHRVGNGWPSPSRRWCTREKVDTLKKYERKIPNRVINVGYAADETHRCVPDIRYPLIEWGMEEADCLSYCYKLGYNWGGLYEHFNRVSCWCCPLQSLDSLRTLRNNFPDLWEKLLLMDLKQRKGAPGFKNDTTITDLDNRFALGELELDPLLA